MAKKYLNWKTNPLTCWDILEWVAIKRIGWVVGVVANHPCFFSYKENPIASITNCPQTNILVTIALLLFYVGLCAPLASHQKPWTARGSAYTILLWKYFFVEETSKKSSPLLPQVMGLHFVYSWFDTPYTSPKFPCFTERLIPPIWFNVYTFQL